MITKERYDRIIFDLISRYPALNVCKESIGEAFSILRNCFLSGHKLLICGNGGSFSDSEHIVGELLKDFKKNRKISSEQSQSLKSVDVIRGEDISNHLQGGFPSIALGTQQSFLTAFSNDIEDGFVYSFSQQLFIYGQQEDVLLAITTSGNSKNVLYAAITAKSKKMKIIGLTGSKDSEISRLADVTIKAPSEETYIVQEYHLPIYHCLCLLLEEDFF